MPGPTHMFGRGEPAPKPTEEMKAKVKKIESDWAKKTPSDLRKEFPGYKGPMKQSDHHSTPMRYYHEED